MKLNKTINNGSWASFRTFPIALLFCSILMASCLEEDLAFDVIESPVLAIFGDASISNDMLSMTGTFYELNKSGILDHTVGIDSTLLSGLSVAVYVNSDELVQQLTTGADGTAVLTTDIADLNGASTLEWVGEYNGVPFRLLERF